jgi:hypothetical protein
MTPKGRLSSSSYSPANRGTGGGGGEEGHAAGRDGRGGSEAGRRSEARASSVLRIQ